MVRFPAPKPATRTRRRRGPRGRDAEALAIAERVLIEGYPMPGTTPGSVLAAGLLDSATRVWVGYVDGEPVSVAAAHQAGVRRSWSTSPRSRPRGDAVPGAAVTWAATLADPEAPAVLIASDDGRPTYERMGYLPLERWTAWLRPAPVTDAGAASAG